VDIDVISRLLHEEYIAERDYRAIGSANSYGLSLIDAENLHQRFEAAKKRWLHASMAYRNYVQGESLNSAKRKASYAMQWHT
jgi:hypothetical protein